MKTSQAVICLVIIFITGLCISSISSSTSTVTYAKDVPATEIQWCSEEDYLPQGSLSTSAEVNVNE